MNLNDELSVLGVSAGSIEELESLADGGVPGKMVLLYAPPGIDGAEAAAVTARESLADPDLAPLDVHLTYPSGDRWTVEEVDQHIVGPSRLRPYERCHVVVSEADMMSQSLHDHLLKTVEEPTADSVFWFAAASGAMLPATLRGRATHELHLQAAPVDHLVARLVEAGASEEAARQALADACGDLALAEAALAYDCAPTLHRVGTMPWRTGNPTSAADQLLLDLAELAVARGLHLGAQGGKKSRKNPTPPTQKGTARRLDAKKLDPADRAHLRRLLRQVLTRWRQEVIADLRQAITRREVADIEGRLTALSDAHIGLLYNTPLSTITAATLARLNA